MRSRMQHHDVGGWHGASHGHSQRGEGIGHRPGFEGTGRPGRGGDAGRGPQDPFADRRPERPEHPAQSEGGERRFAGGRPERPPYGERPEGGRGRGGHRGGGPGPQRTPRMLAHGDLRLLLIALLEQQPRHGYELIQLIGEMFNGQYAPSAGAVYPALGQLQELGLVQSSEDGPRRLHALTGAGRAFAEENAEALSQARERTERSARMLVKASLPAPVRAGMSALKRALGSHTEHWNADTSEQVARILLRAAAEIGQAGRD